MFARTPWHAQDLVQAIDTGGAGAAANTFPPNGQALAFISEPHLELRPGSDPDDQA